MRLSVQPGVRIKYSLSFSKGVENAPNTTTLPRSQVLPSFPSLLVRKSGRGPGIFSHVSDVGIERMVERV